MVDATMYFSGTELTYSAEIITPSAINTVKEKPIGSGMFEVSIKETVAAAATPENVAIAYRDGEVRLTAMNPDGLSASQTFKVRRNKRPVRGDASLVADAEVEVDADDATTIGTSAEDDANVVSVAITKSVLVPGDDDDSFYHFTDNDELLFTAFSADDRVATAVIDADGKLVVTGLMSGEARVTVIAEDTGGLIVSKDVTVTVNASPMVKKMLPESIVVVGETTYTIEDISSYFSDEDDTLGITVVNGIVAVAEGEIITAGDLLMITKGNTPGITKITVIATEGAERDPPQMVSQSFTVEFK